MPQENQKISEEAYKVRFSLMKEAEEMKDPELDDTIERAKQAELNFDAARGMALIVPEVVLFFYSGHVENTGPATLLVPLGNHSFNLGNPPSIALREISKSLQELENKMHLKCLLFVIMVDSTTTVSRFATDVQQPSRCVVIQTSARCGDGSASQSRFPQNLNPLDLILQNIFEPGHPLFKALTRSFDQLTADGYSTLHPQNLDCIPLDLVLRPSLRYEFGSNQQYLHITFGYTDITADQQYIFVTFCHTNFSAEAESVFEESLIDTIKSVSSETGFSDRTKLKVARFNLYCALALGRHFEYVFNLKDCFRVRGPNFRGAYKIYDVCTDH